MPKVPIEELLAAAQSLVGRLARYGSPEAFTEEAAALARAGPPYSRQILPPPEEPSQGIMDAGTALQNVFDRVFGKLRGPVFKGTDPTPPQQVWYSETKPGASLPSQRQLEEGDLFNRLTQKALTAADRLPQKGTAEIPFGVQKRVMTWASRAPQQVPIPHSASLAIRNVERAGKTLAPDSKAVLQAQAYLEKHPVAPSQNRLVGEEYAINAPSAEPSPADTAEGLRLVQQLREILADPSVLTPRQKKTLVLRYGLDRPEGEMTQSALAKALGIKQPSVAGNEKAALAALRKKLGIATPKEPQSIEELVTLALKPSKPKLVKPPLNKQMLEARKAQFESGPAFRLVPDPQGTVEIGGVQYRREPAIKEFPAE